MTGQDFQDKLDAIVVDLQTKGKGQTIMVSLRDTDNTPYLLPLSSTAQGVVNQAELNAIQPIVDQCKVAADAYETQRVPVTTALDAFKTVSAPHQALSDAASLARKNYNDAVSVDPAFQAAKTALDTARADAGYIAAVESYGMMNVSENFGNLGDAKGKYIVQ